MIKFLIVFFFLIRTRKSRIGSIIDLEKYMIDQHIYIKIFDEKGVCVCWCSFQSIIKSPFAKYDSRNRN